MNTLKIVLQFSEITEQVDRDISEALHEDEEYLKLSPEGRIKVLEQLNGMLHHTLYEIEGE